jgi:uncharacterized protein (TIGR03437 family)
MKTKRTPMISSSGTTLWCGALLILSAGWASADDTAYMITTTAAQAYTTQQFGTVDLKTGVFTPVASQNVSGGWTGLGVVNGKLYTADADGDLYEINPADGSLTIVGTASGVSYNFFGSTLTGLYAKGRGFLYSVDPGTGAATLIGSGGLPTGCTVGSLSTNSATLYYACFNGGTLTDNLFTIDVTNSTATPVGSLGGAFLGALTTINGTLYGGEDSPASAVVSVNPSNGAVSTGASLQGLSGGAYSVGLASLLASPAAPTILRGGVVPIYSSSTTIQPGEWVSIFGTNLASAPTTWNGNFPITLGGTSVTIDGISAYLWYVSPTQINLQAPDNTNTGKVNVVVTTANGSATSTVTLGEFAPSFSVLGDGKHVAGIILRPDGSGTSGGGAYDIIGPTGTSLGYPTVAAKAGDTVELYGVGFGPTTPPVPAGKPFSGSAVTTNTVQLTIGAVPVLPSGAGMGSAGLYQVNVTIPAGLGTGDQTLVAAVGGVQTQSGVLISLQ